ncbi:MAG TPA: glycosyltransferase family 9 protein [Thermoleophilaceae bacterium]|nr:glycosyltransferase family 9 protein [Thermoleophilaceae bacterium]
MAVGGRPRLVALRALGLGDMLTAVPALRGLARAYPDHEPLLAAPEPLAPLARQAGWTVVPTGELEPLPEALHGAEIAANLHGRGPESHTLLAAARPRRAIWFEHPDVPASRGAPAWSDEEHEVERWCRLLHEHGIGADPGDLALEPPPGPPPDGVRGATLVHPGAASAARRWPVERFAAVARSEAAAGRRVVVSGSYAERQLAQEVAALAGLPASVVIAGATDLAGLARVVAIAGRVVCGDTGVAHLASALGTPSVVLFGPTAPSRWGPPAGDPRHTALWAGRGGDPHAQRPDAGLLEITVSDVLDALEGLDERAPAPAVAC